MSEPLDLAWRDTLARSKAQIASGDRLDLLPLLERLRRSAEWLEAEQGVTADGEKLTANR